MISHKKVFFVFLGLFVYLCFAQIALAAEDAWLSVRSKNFQMVGNASEKELRDAATKLEQFRVIFSQLFSDMKLNSPIPTTVVLFKDEKSFQPFKPVNEDGTLRDYVTGYFIAGRDVNYIAFYPGSEKENPYRTIFHEYVHFLIDNNLGKTNIPPWFNEGIAEYYEQIRIENDQNVTLGGVNPSHLKLLQQKGIVPLEKFFETDYYTLNRQPKENVVAFYAQSWALVHFLLQNGKDDKSKRLNEFAELVINGKSSREAFRQIFKTDFPTLENELKNYIRQKSLQTSTINFDKKLTFDAKMSSAPLSASEAKAYQGDLLMHNNRLKEAEALLKEALAINPDSSFANTSYGLLKMKQNDFGEAGKYLEKAVQADARNYLAHFSHAYVLSQYGMSDFGFISGYTAPYAEIIRTSLRKAIALNPDFAESYQLYAYINMVRNENIDEGFEMINKALRIAPGNQWYLLRSAELLMRKEDFSNARRVTLKILQTAADDKLKLYAQNTLIQINSWEAQLEEIKNFKNRPKDDGLEKERILSEEEILRLNEKAKILSLNQSLRRPRSGESRILGYLTQVACEDRGVFYTVKTDDRLQKFRSESITDVALIAFDSNFRYAQFGCDSFKGEHLAVVTFRISGNEKSPIAGETVAIEFVPKNFQFVDPSTKMELEK
jgi:tetratricopeptide (TPR) repeat protein